MTAEPTKKPLVDSVLSRIETERIAPTARWHFLLREGVVCSVGLVSVSVGAVAVVAIIFEMRNAWWDSYGATHDSFLTFSVDALPFVWLVCLAVFTGLLYASVRYTKRGYRHAVHTLVFAAVGMSTVGGTAMYALGAGPFADEWVGSFVPFHRPLIERERERWMSPLEGRLAGIVREVPYSESVIWLEGADSEIYQVDTSDFTIPERQMFRAGDHIRIVGVPTSTPRMLHGCIVFTKLGDILERAHTKPVLGKSIEDMPMHERKPLFARSTECEGIRPYARLAPKE